MNTEILKLKEEIINAINCSKLPMEVKRLILFEIYGTVENAVKIEIAKESEQNGNTE